MFFSLSASSPQLSHSCQKFIYITLYNHCITQETCSRPWYLTHSYIWSENQHRRTTHITTVHDAGVSIIYLLQSTHLRKLYDTKINRSFHQQQPINENHSFALLLRIMSTLTDMEKLPKILVLEALIFQWLVRTGSGMVLNTFMFIWELGLDLQSQHPQLDLRDCKYQSDNHFVWGSLPTFSVVTSEGNLKHSGSSF